MKHTESPLAVFAFLLCIILFFECKKTDPSSGGSGPDVDKFSDHFLFNNFTKRQGRIPTASSGTSAFKISVRDTVYLADELLKPIKFLHKDTTRNIAGVYVQVVLNGSPASYYYDVSELENMKDNDTVSVITIGIDPTDLEKPQSGEVKIVPYDKNKQPVTQITRQVKIIENKVDPPSGGGNGCGLGLAAGEKWDWVASLTTDNKFYNDPDKVNSAAGQDIEGSCCAGVSSWPLFCPGQQFHNTKLHFATYYRINFENFSFFTNGKFFRQTLEDSPVPLPDKSDFCSPGSAGMVQESLKHTTYEGNWTITRAILPPNKPVWLRLDSLKLNLATTSSNGTGFGNPGGIIHQLDCEIGALTLFQVNADGNGEFPLVKFYSRRKPGEPSWYN